MCSAPILVLLGCSCFAAHCLALHCSRPRSEIERSICSSLEGHQRAILGTLTVEALIGDRRSFAEKVTDIASDDMRRMGLCIVSYTISVITDERKYIESLGIRQTEIVKREAAEGAALHQNQARIKESDEELAQHLKVNLNKNKTEESNCATQLLASEYEARVNAAAATTALASGIQEAKERAKLYVETARADAEKVQAQLEVERGEILKARLVLEKTVQAKADAELYAKDKEAEGIIRIANARAKEREMMAKAEADGMRWKAAAFREFGEAALITQALDRLPEIAAAITAPLAKTERIVFVGSGDGGAGGSGPSRLSRDIEKMIAEVPESVKALTGLDIAAALQRYTGTLGAVDEAGVAAATARLGGMAALPAGPGPAAGSTGRAGGRLGGPPKPPFAPVA